MKNNYTNLNSISQGSGAPRTKGKTKSMFNQTLSSKGMTSLDHTADLKPNSPDMSLYKNTVTTRKIYPKKLNENKTMKHQSVFKEYAEHKLNELMVVDDLAAVAGAAGAIMTIGQVIGGLKNAFKAKLFGCDSITDSVQQADCKIKEINLQIGKLRGSVAKCTKTEDINACKERIDSEIDTLVNQKTDLAQRS